MTLSYDSFYASPEMPYEGTSFDLFQGFDMDFPPLFEKQEPVTDDVWNMPEFEFPEFEMPEYDMPEMPEFDFQKFKLW